MKRLFWGGRNIAPSQPRGGTVWCLLVVAAAGVLASSCATQVTAKQTAQVYYDLGNAYSKLGEQSKATAAYLNALKLDSTLLQASYNLARVYIETKNYKSALSLLDRLLAKDPENLVVLATLGYTYFHMGDDKRALSYYEQVLRLSPTDNDALYNSATILAKVGETKKAIDDFARLYRLNSDASLLLILGKLELAEENVDQGIHYLEAYRQAKPDDVEGLTTLADAYRKTQLYDKALNAYDAILKIKSDDADVLFAKADILLTAIQDASNGMKALTAAVAAGYANKKSLAALVANPELVDKSAVEGLLKSKKLIEEKPAAQSPPPKS